MNVNTSPQNWKYQNSNELQSRNFNSLFGHRLGDNFTNRQESASVTPDTIAVDPAIILALTKPSKIPETRAIHPTAIMGKRNKT